MPQFVFWGGCLCVALLYISDHVLVWAVLALYALCFCLFLRERRQMRRITGLGFNGQLYLLFGDTKVQITSCEDVRVFPSCILAIAKIEQSKACFIKRMLLGSIALKFDRDNMSEKDFHLVSRHFSLA